MREPVLQIVLNGLRSGMVSGTGTALSYYDTGAKQWRAEPGEFDVLVRRSSEQIEWRGKLTLEAGSTAASK